MAVILSQHWPFKIFPSWHTLTRQIKKLAFKPVFFLQFLYKRQIEITFQPIDYHLVDPQRAKDFYQGTFPLAGRIVKSGSVSPFAITAPSTAWEKDLQNFSWLRHLAAENSALAKAYSRTLVLDWIKYSPPKFNNISWREDIIAKRLIAWLSHSALLQNGAQKEFRKKFLASLNFQFCYLQNLLRTSDNTLHSLYGHIALAFAALALKIPENKKNNIFMRFEQALNQQILPDGNHISRSPVILMELLLNLLALKRSFTLKGVATPLALIEAIERMFPALRFFIHTDGSLARFNGVGPVLKQALENIFSLDETEGRPFQHAPYAGYQRLSFGNTTIIADTGKIAPKPMRAYSNAGCLSFEMSSNNHCFVINTGLDPFGLEEHKALGRATAAHSTANINESSSCCFKKIKKDSKLYIQTGPENVSLSVLKNNKHIGFIASHDGYLQRFQLIHERGIRLSQDGKIIEGFDHFFTPEQIKPPVKNNAVTIRFHLHPEVEVSYDENAHLRLEVIGGDAWIFNCPDEQFFLEDSIFFANNTGPKRTKQIVLHVNPKYKTHIRWRFVRIGELKITKKQF